MNQDAIQDNFGLIPSQETEQMVDELLTVNLDELVKKYGRKHLFDKVFKPEKNLFSAVNALDFRRHQFITFFWPKDKPVSLTPEQRAQIINTCSQITDTNDLQIKLKQIHPDLQIPENLNIVETQTGTKQIALAYFSVENLLLDNIAEDYLPDTLSLLTMDNNKLEEIRDEIVSIAQKFIQQMDKNQNDQTNSTLANDCLNLLSHIGRTKLFISEEKEEENLNELSDIVAKLEIAIQAALAIRKNNPQADQTAKDLAFTEIKKIIQPTIKL